MKQKDLFKVAKLTKAPVTIAKVDDSHEKDCFTFGVFSTRDKAIEALVEHGYVPEDDRFVLDERFSARLVSGFAMETH